VEVKRAFRKYLGPDDPGPFMDMINSMSFGCRHMKEYNRNGVFCLNGSIPEGRVRVMRVGDVDYIWTYGGGTGALYIILIPDLTRGFVIPVTPSKGDYAFGDFAVLEGGNIVRYQYDKDEGGMTGAGVRQQYMPYIFKAIATSHVSVGDPGNLFYPDPVNDWHNKFYVVDCTGDQSAQEVLWRPPSQVATVGFGEDLLPPWYSMSPLTAHNFHWCFEAAIDQSKRIYQPVGTDVTLESEEISIPNFTLLSRNVLRYVYLYPILASRFYGKNAFDLTDGAVIAFGESIYMSGVVTASIPVDVDPILFFWPWIPYLDEIRSFNILYYSKTTPFDYFRMYPSLEPFKKYGIGYYTKEGAYQTQELFEDEASFSEVNKSTNFKDSAAPSDCGCGDCGTGVWGENVAATVAPYNSSGTKYIPIGLIGGRIPISMKTTWQQTGSGPVSLRIDASTISGNYPWNSLHSGSFYGLDHWYESCCITDFKNTRVRTRAYNETASNLLTMQQSLRVGDDVILEADSSMNYSMQYSYQDEYNGTIEGVVTPPEVEPPVCVGHINYTSQQMSVSQTQNLSWTDDTAYPDLVCTDPMAHYTFSWSLSGGGSLSSTTEQNTVYTAPATNPNCASNATISLLCNGVEIDTLEIAIDAVGSSAYMAYSINICNHEKRCVDIGESIVEKVTYGEITITCDEHSGKDGCATCASVTGQSYRCNGTVFTKACDLSGSMLNYGPAYTYKTCSAVQVLCSSPPYRRQTCDEAWTSKCIRAGLPSGWGTIDTRTEAQIAAGCCPAQLL
jgi:hypothetical protein